MGCGSSVKEGYEEPLGEQPKPEVTDSTVSNSRESVASMASSRRSLSLMRRSSSARSSLSQGLTLIPRSGKIHEHYVLDKAQIGKGAVGTVYKAKSKVSGLQFAIKKCFDVREDDRKTYKRESAILSSMDHPNIIRLHEVFEDRRCVYFVMELCSGGELLDRIVADTYLTESQCACIMKQIFCGISYVHKLDFCHRDVKPENLLLHDDGPIETNVFKLIDFGTATQIIPGHFLDTLIGTPPYMAPEVLELCYDSKFDVWSCGVILYFLLSGRLPFSGESNSEIFDKIKAGKYSLAETSWQQISEDAKDLFGKCLTMNARERPSAEQCLGHVWIKHEAPNATAASLPAHVFANMKNFNETSELRKIALHSVARHLSSSSSNDLRAHFLAMDANNDGHVNFDEMRTGLQQSCVGIPDEQIRIMFDKLDLDGSGSIDYTEFIAAALDTRCQVQEACCWAAFRAFDKNGDGAISAAELEEVLNYDAVEAMMESRDVSELLREVDKSGDGQISFDEFMAMVTNTPGGLLPNQMAETLPSSS